MSKEIKLEDDEVISANELYKRWRDKEIGISNCVSLVKLAYDKKLIKSYQLNRLDVEHGKLIKYYIEVKPFQKVQCGYGVSFVEFDPSDTYFKLEDVRLAEREMLDIEPPDADNGEKTDATDGSPLNEQPSPQQGDKTEIARLKAELEAVRSSLNGLQSEAEQARTALKNAEEERERTNEKLEATENALRTVKAERDRLAKELENVRQQGAQGAEKLHIRTLWRYVLELENRGHTDVDIRNALDGDGFSMPAINTLLYDGEGQNYDAVKKWGQRRFSSDKQD